MEDTVRLSKPAIWAVEPDRAGLTRSGVAVWGRGRSHRLMGCLNIEMRMKLRYCQRELSVIFPQGGIFLGEFIHVHT